MTAQKQRVYGRWGSATVVLPQGTVSWILSRSLNVTEPGLDVCLNFFCLSRTIAKLGAL